MLKYTSVQVYSDSLEAINILSRDGHVDHPFREEIEGVCQLIYQEESIHVFQCCRATVGCADILAKEAHAEKNLLSLVPQVPHSCRSQFLLDIQGVMEVKGDVS